LNIIFSTYYITHINLIFNYSNLTLSKYRIFKSFDKGSINFANFTQMHKNLLTIPSILVKKKESNPDNSTAAPKFVYVCRLLKTTDITCIK